MYALRYARPGAVRFGEEVMERGSGYAFVRECANFGILSTNADSSSALGITVFA